MGSGAGRVGDAVRAAGRRRSSAARGDVGRAARLRGGEPGGVGRRDAVAVDGFGRGEGIRVDGEEHVVGDDDDVDVDGHERLRHVEGFIDAAAREPALLEMIVARMARALFGCEVDDAF